MTNAATMKIDGIIYEVIREYTPSNAPAGRSVIQLRRPRGKKVYEAVRYENGAISGAV